MNDLDERLEKLRDDAAECAMLAMETSDKKTRDLLIKLSEHLTLLATKLPSTFLGRSIHEKPFGKKAS